MGRKTDLNAHINGPHQVGRENIVTAASGVGATSAPTTEIISLQVDSDDLARYEQWCRVRGIGSSRVAFKRLLEAVNA